MEYILYCDESAGSGPKYSDFFGGCIVSSENLHPVINAMNAKKEELNFLGEIKWSKVSAQYLDRYIQIVDLFFDFVRDGKIKVRIMFRDNNDQPSDIRVTYNSEEKYFKLYYQFIKQAFGFKDIPEDEGDVYVRVYFDKLPDNREKCDKFKEFVRNIPNIGDFSSMRGRFHIRKEDVAEVISHEHVLLQCTDIVLGAMYFRLNDLHKVKPEGSRVRGKRTIAKEKLYNHINLRIREILPYFNIGISTGQRGFDHPDWELPYSHWKFVPK